MTFWLILEEKHMLISPRYKPIVFGGPSLELAMEKYGKYFDFRPPIRRGDLEALAGDKRRSGCVLITDGVFGSTLSVSPVECLRVLQKGWLLLGSSSMGALRAADCNSAGMVGIGHVYMGYQLGYYKSDADVSVVYAGVPSKEITISYVHADYIGRILQRSQSLSSVNHRKFLSFLRRTPWYDRNRKSVASEFSIAHGKGELAEVFLDMSHDASCHPKKLDALLACDYMWGLYKKRGLHE